MDTVYTTMFDTPEGRMLSASFRGCLVYLGLPCPSGRGFRGFIEKNARDARILENYDENRDTVNQVLEFLSGERHEFNIKLKLLGTPFQMLVWTELGRIPYGETRTYGQVASLLKSPKASRAVGAANGANPIPLVVPCHRVIASGGKLGGYAGGLGLKRRLLALERAKPQKDELL